MAQKNEFSGLLNVSAQKLLAAIARAGNDSLYGAELSRLTGLSKGAANQSLRKLLEFGLVSKERRGREHYYMINKGIPAMKEFKIFFNLVELFPLVSKIKKYSKSIILFGSCAQGADLHDSDVDLFIVSAEKKTVNQIVSDFSKKNSRKIAALVFEPLEAIRLRRKDPVLMTEIEKGIAVWRDFVE